MDEHIVHEEKEMKSQNLKKLKGKTELKKIKGKKKIFGIFSQGSPFINSLTEDNSVTV